MGATALFEQIDHDRYRATELSRGPWDPRALHGGPPAALLAGVLDRLVADFARDELQADAPLFPARFTAELLRPVPLGELAVTTDLRRPGRKICMADAALVQEDGTVCMRATLGTIRRKPFGHPAGPQVTPPPPPGAGHGMDPAAWPDEVSFGRDAVEHRFVAGEFDRPGPATDWIRLTVPIVGDREATPLERVVAAADFGNGISGWFDMGEATFLNPDLHVNLHRLPVGEWVALDAVTHVSDEGIGLAESRLFDERGPIGRATQSLLVDAR